MDASLKAAVQYGKRTKYIVTDLFEGDVLKLASTFDENLILDIFMGMCCGLYVAHVELNMTHCEVKLSKYLYVSSGGRYLIKLGDLGTARMLDKDAMTVGNKVYTRLYCSPERLHTAKYKSDKEDDIWALGVCLYALIMNGNTPFENDLDNIRTATWTKSNITSALFHRIIDDCLQVKPSDRLTIQDILKMVWTESPESLRVHYREDMMKWFPELITSGIGLAVNCYKQP